MSQTIILFRSALCWIKDNDLLGICLGKGFDDCCYRINGGWNGYEDRKENTKSPKKSSVSLDGLYTVVSLLGLWAIASIYVVAKALNHG